MFTQNPPVARISGQVVELAAGQKRSNGGSNDTDVTEFADIPVGPRAPAAVTTVTPVGR